MWWSWDCDDHGLVKLRRYDDRYCVIIFLAPLYNPRCTSHSNHLWCLSLHVVWALLVGSFVKEFNITGTRNILKKYRRLSTVLTLLSHYLAPPCLHINTMFPLFVAHEDWSVIRWDDIRSPPCCWFGYGQAEGRVKTDLTMELHNDMKKGSHDLPQMKTYQQHKMVKSG